MTILKGDGFQHVFAKRETALTESAKIVKEKKALLEGQSDDLDVDQIVDVLLPLLDKMGTDKERKIFALENAFDHIKNTIEAEDEKPLEESNLYANPEGEKAPLPSNKEWVANAHKSRKAIINVTPIVKAGAKTNAEIMTVVTDKVKSGDLTQAEANDISALLGRGNRGWYNAILQGKPDLKESDDNDADDNLVGKTIKCPEEGLVISDITKVEDTEFFTGKTQDGEVANISVNEDDSLTIQINDVDYEVPKSEWEFDGVSTDDKDDLEESKTEGRLADNQ